MTAFGRLALWTGLAILAYGLLNGLSNTVLMPSASFISLRPQVALPMLLGLLVNPWAGFLAGFCGNILGDGLSNFGLWTHWNWHLANGLLGLGPGLVHHLGVGRIVTVRDFGILESAVVVTCAVAVAAAVGLDVLFLHRMVFPSSWHSWILPAFLSNVVNAFVLVPTGLILARRIIWTLEIRTIVLVTILLLAAVFGTAGAIAGSVLDDLASPEAVIEAFYVAGVVTVFLLVVGFLASVVLVRRFTGPVTVISRAAEALERGDYDVEDLDGLSTRTDELGQLARVFLKMSGAVKAREKRLQNEVRELRIVIDRRRQAEEVAEIVETDYFRGLKAKAREFKRVSKAKIGAD